MCVTVPWECSQNNNNKKKKANWVRGSVKADKNHPSTHKDFPEVFSEL